jgi:hypothetical protein
VWQVTVAAALGDAGEDDASALTGGSRKKLPWITVVTTTTVVTKCRMFVELNILSYPDDSLIL